MTATNHALTGAFLGLAVGNPWIAVPVAFASHFVCDAIPHFSRGGDDAVLFRSRFFKNELLLDAFLCVTIAAGLFVTHPLHWFLAVVCAFLATSPDLYWIGNYHRAQSGKKISYTTWFARFAGFIQWFQKPIGIVVEAAWAIALILLILPFVR